MSYSRLRELAGEHPNDPQMITDLLIKEAPDDLEGFLAFVRPYVLSQARNIIGRKLNQVMRNTLMPPARLRESRPAGGKVVVGETVRTLYYKLADGTIIAWEDMTLAMIKQKKAVLKRQLGPLAADIGILEAAEDLLAGQPDGTSIGSIPGWREKMQDILGRGRERSGSDS